MPNALLQYLMGQNRDDSVMAITYFRCYLMPYKLGHILERKSQIQRQSNFFTHLQIRKKNVDKIKWHGFLSYGVYALHALINPGLGAGMF